MFNKSEIMKNAWEMARKKAVKNSERMGRVQVGLKWKDGIVNKGVIKSAKNYISSSLVNAWDQAKTAIKEAAQAAKKAAVKIKTVWNTRTVVLLETAERLGLNRGKAWYGKPLDVDTCKISPEMEGEMVCYVYE